MLKTKKLKAASSFLEKLVDFRSQGQCQRLHLYPAGPDHNVAQLGRGFEIVNIYMKQRCVRIVKISFSLYVANLCILHYVYRSQ